MNGNDLPKIFTAAQARAAGMSASRLRRSDVRRLHRGVYCMRGTTYSLADEVAALLRAIPAAEFASHHTAALLHGGVVPTPSRIHLGTTRDLRTTLPGVALHRVRREIRPVRVRTLPVVDAAETFVDLAATLEFADLLVLGDSLVHRRSTTVDTLRHAADRMASSGAYVREVVSLVRAGAESPGETRTRLLLTSAGLPEPVMNHSIRDAFGREVRRIDLAYPEWMVAVEYDGRHHIDRRSQWEADIRRREELEAMGWRFVVVTARDIHREQGELVARVAALLRERGAPVPADLDGWRRHA